MLEVRDLRAGYGRIPILHGVSLAVGERETVGVLGHNGMGKSTLIKTLMGTLPATAGRIVFDDNDLTGLPPHRRARLGIGYVPQGREIFPNLSVRDNLRMGAVGAGADERAVIPEVPRDPAAAETAARSDRRLTERRRAADPGHRANPVCSAAPAAPRRADRGRPALDHRPDR